jgi:hypothetical protein
METCCGFAATTPFGADFASQLSVAYFAATVGERFVAEAALILGGRRQGFSEARLYVESHGDRTLAAVATAIPLKLSAHSSAWDRRSGETQRPPRATRWISARTNRSTIAGRLLSSQVFSIGRSISRAISTAASRPKAAMLSASE